MTRNLNIGAATPGIIAGRRLRLPIVAAPMFLISGPELVIEACRSGIIGAFPTTNARTTEELDGWMSRMSSELSDGTAAPCY